MCYLGRTIRNTVSTHGLLAADDILIGAAVGTERGAGVFSGLADDGATTGFETGRGGCSTGFGGAVSLGFTSWYVGGGGVFVSLGSETGVVSL